MSNVKSNLNYLLRMKNITPTYLAAKTGVPQPTIFRILTGDSSDPRSSTLKPIAAYFGLTVEMLREGNVRDEKEETFEPLAEKPTPILTPPPPATRRMLIRGVVESDGGVILYEIARQMETIEFPVISENAYALQVHGNALRPRVRPGEVLVIDSSKPTRPGDDVLLHLATGVRIIRTLLFVRNSELTVSNVSQNERIEAIPMCEIEKTECIVAIVNI